MTEARPTPTPKYDLYTPAETITTRIFPELAAEIGLNESIILLQIAHWLRITDHERDGQWWAYKSLRRMRKEDFPYFSLNTINRAIKSLINQHLIVSRDDLNARQGDDTRWFALDIEGLSRLKSIVILSANPASATRTLSQNGTGVFQNGTGVFQNGTTLPEITTENKDKHITAPQAAAVVCLEIADEPDPHHVKEKPARAPTAHQQRAEALMVAFGLDAAETFKSKRRSEFTQAASDIGKLDLVAEQIPALYRYVLARSKREKWSGFGPSALAKYAPDFLADERRKAAPAKARAEQVEYEAWLHAQPAHDPKWSNYPGLVAHRGD